MPRQPSVIVFSRVPLLAIFLVLFAWSPIAEWACSSKVLPALLKNFCLTLSAFCLFVCFFIVSFSFSFFFRLRNLDCFSPLEENQRWLSRAIRSAELCILVVFVESLQKKCIGQGYAFPRRLPESVVSCVSSCVNPFVSCTVSRKDKSPNNFNFTKTRDSP